VRYLRLLTNAVVAGLIGAAYLTIVLLQLNPHMPLPHRVVLEWYAALSLFYGLHLAVGIYLLMMILEIVGLPVSGPAWISVRLQAWAGTVLCAGAALLMWLNLRAFSVTIGSEAAQRMAAGAVGATGVAIVLLSIAIIYYSVGRRGSRAAAAILGISLAASMALPLAARGPGDRRAASSRATAQAFERLLAAGQSNPAPMRVPERGRVVLIFLEGASLEYLWPRAAEGQFPNFGTILDRGAAMDLATLRPTQPEPVGTALATGKYPPRNGVTSGATYYVRSRGADVELLPDYCLAHALVRFGIVNAAPHDAASWRARPLWRLAATRGLRSGVVRWPVTYPAAPMNGFLISDRLHLVSRSLLRLADETVASPRDVLPAARAAFAEGPVINEIAPVPVTSAGGTLEAIPDQPTRLDRIYGRLGRELAVAYQPDIFAIRYTGLDVIGHAYLRYAMPRAFGDVPEAEIAEYGGVLDRYYAFLDAEIGAALEILAPGDLLLVVSGFGMEPMTVPKRVLARVLGDERVSGTHERAPDGFLLAYGTQVRSGKLQRGAVVDVVPTILYYLGLPVGRDMDGYARADLFVREFSESRPIVFIPSYER
jgi:hypothetical protein